MHEYGIRSGQKTGFTIQNITLKNFSQAIFLDPGSSGGTIANATLTENIYGLQMSDADSNTVSESVVTGNSHTGIHMDADSEGNILDQNTVCDNAISDITNDGVNSGDDNTCSDVSNWNDDGASGCTFPCVPCSCVGATAQFVCGDAVTESCKLNCDLTSTGNCFTAGADRIVIDGDGFSITGDGTGNGVTIDAKSQVTVKNLTIHAFGRGASLSSAIACKLQDNTIHLNTDGIVLAANSSGNLVDGNTIQDNTGDGIRVEASANSNTISNNTTGGNSGDGFYFQSHAESTAR